ncbi:hypothetical protein DyAD56_11485 [Dyella sp. AD56]|nr:hypothetical protein DyAD56_11485 [Dyella sp. AD56]
MRTLNIEGIIRSMDDNPNGRLYQQLLMGLPQATTGPVSKSKRQPISSAGVCLELSMPLPCGYFAGDYLPCFSNCIFRESIALSMVNEPGDWLGG